MTLKQHIEKYTQEKGLKQKMDERNIKIDDICNYIIERAKKELDSKDGAIDSDTVFGWAVHYIEDAYKDKETKKALDPAIVKVNDGNDDEDEEENKTEEVKDNREEEKGEKQLSLFDFNEQ